MTQDPHLLRAETSQRREQFHPHRELQRAWPPRKHRAGGKTKCRFNGVEREEMGRGGKRWEEVEEMGRDGKRWEEMGRDGKGKWLGKQIGVEVIGIDWVLLFIKLNFKTS